MIFENFLNSLKFIFYFINNFSIFVLGEQIENNIGACLISCQDASVGKFRLKSKFGVCLFNKQDEQFILKIQAPL